MALLNFCQQRNMNLSEGGCDLSNIDCRKAWMILETSVLGIRVYLQQQATKLCVDAEDPSVSLRCRERLSFIPQEYLASYYIDSSKQVFLFAFATLLVDLV